MPSYDYGCLDCEHSFDKILPISKMYEPESEPCPNCGKEGTVKKIITSPAVHYTFMGGTVQGSSKTPEGFKDRLREMKKNIGPDAKGIVV